MAETDDFHAIFDDLIARLTAIQEQLDNMDTDEADALKAEFVGVTTQITGLRNALDEALAPPETQAAPPSG